MSKPHSSHLSSAQETVAYWRRRLFRNSYTRAGRTHRVRHWSVKVQYAGRRQTWSLAAPNREAAAREAQRRYRAWRAASPPRPDAPAPILPTPQLVRRSNPILEELPQPFSVRFDGTEGPSYFPLGTTDPALARRRAQAIQKRLQQPGNSARQNIPRELTLALEWSANPVVWTYFTVHTQPTASKQPSLVQPNVSSTGLEGVAVVEPDPSLRRALGVAINLHSRFRCAGEFSGTAEALGGLSTNSIALVLVNHTLDGLSGAGFLDRLRLLKLPISGLTYTVYPNSDQLFAATPGGAIGYLLKRTPPARFLDPLSAGPISRLSSIDLAGRALTWFQRSLGTAASAGTTGELSRLTKRELEILALLSKGFVDKEIAESLRISVWTVHGHAKNIYEKLGVHSRTEAAVKYLQK